MIKEKIKAFIKKDGTQSFISSVISILAGLLIGFVVMIIVSLFSKDTSISNALTGLGIMFKGPFASNRVAYVLSNTGDMIFYATPLIMTGLSVALAYKTGLFNIGAPGQYLMGVVGSLLVALYIPVNDRNSGILVWVLAVFAGMICGALWGLIPGILKAFFNINEVIICIMTNWIAANLVTLIFKGTTAIHSTENTKGGYLTKVLDAYTPKFGLDKIFKGSYIDGGIFFAIIIAIIIYIILNKTTFGYELKACGHNKDAAKYAGLNEKRNIILSMAIAGALAGLGACFYYLNPGIEFKYISQYQSLPSYGFTGIASAFLANCNPIGVVVSSLLIRYLNMGGEALTKVNFNRYVADVVIAVIIYLAGFTRFIREIMNKRKKEIKKIEPDKILQAPENDDKKEASVNG